MVAKENPLISVVMCVYNGEKYLQAAITSILSQTFSDFEFIIVNDGSSDLTESIILSNVDQRIIYIKNDTNLGIIKSSNSGLSLAKGKYIARMDSDDIALPQRFEKQINVFNLYPKIDIVNANAYFLSEDGTRYREQKSMIETFSFEAVRFLIYLQNFIYNPTVMVNGDVLRKYRYTDHVSRDFIEDYDLWLRMINEGSLCYTIEDRLVFYRDNSSSINHTKKSKQVDSMLLICSEMLIKKFNFVVDKSALKVLLEEGGEVNFSSLEMLNQELKRYFMMLEHKHTISLRALKEMKYWRRQKLMIIGLKSLKYVSISYKVSILKFLIFNAHWLASRSSLILLKRTLFSKYHNLK